MLSDVLLEVRDAGGGRRVVGEELQGLRRLPLLLLQLLEERDEAARVVAGGARVLRAVLVRLGLVAAGVREHQSLARDARRHLRGEAWVLAERERRDGLQA